MSDEFNLDDLIRETLDHHDSPDPHVVARDVAAAVPSRYLRQVVAALLPDAVRGAIRRQRPPVVESHRETTGHAVNGKRGLGAMTNDPWRMRVYVPGVGWKFQGDLTADECDAIADDYAARAAQNEAHAKRWRLTAERMRRVGAATLRDLGMEDAA